MINWRCVANQYLPYLLILKVYNLIDLLSYLIAKIARMWGIVHP